MSLPAEVRRLRQDKLANIMGLRAQSGLDYDVASNFLNAFMQRIIQHLRQQEMGGAGYAVGGLTVAQKQQIQNALFEFIEDNRLNIPLRQLLGVENVTSQENGRIITLIFGSNAREVRSEYFRAALGAIFDRLVARGAQLKVVFSDFGDNLKAVFLKQSAPVKGEDDLIQYHVTVARNRIHDKLLSSYHFSNYFYAPAAGGAGGGAPQVTRRQTYYSNTGEPMSYDNSISAAVRERKGAAATEQDIELYKKIAAWQRHLAAPTANTRAEVGAAVLAKEPPQERPARRQEVAVNTAAIEAAEASAIEEAIRRADAERAAMASGAAAAAAAEPEERSGLQIFSMPSMDSSSKYGAFMEKYGANMNIMKQGKFGFGLMESTISQILTTPDMVFSTILLPEDMKLIYSLLTSPLLDRAEAEYIAASIVRDRYGFKEAGLVPSQQSLIAANSAMARLATKEGLEDMKAVMAEQGTAEITAESMVRPLFKISEPLYHKTFDIIVKSIKSVARVSEDKPSLEDFKELHRILFSIPKNQLVDEIMEQLFNRPIYSGISKAARSAVQKEIKAQRSAAQSAANRAKVSQAEQEEAAAAAAAELLAMEEANAAKSAAKSKGKTGKKKKGGVRKTRRTRRGAYV